MAKSSMTKSSEISVFDPAIVGPAVGSSFAKLDPRVQIRNPVMFVVEIVASLTTLLLVRDLATQQSQEFFVPADGKVIVQGTDADDVWDLTVQ